MTLLNAALRRYRERSGLSCGQIAVRCGVTRRCVQHWVYGTRTPSQSSREAVCRLLGIDSAQYDSMRGAA